MSFLMNVGRPGRPGGGAGPLWKPFIATSIKGLADVTRNSIGTATDASGSVVAFATDMPRQTSAGLLVEDAATNLLTYSQDFSNAAWTKGNVTVSDDGTSIAGLPAQKLEVSSTTFTTLARGVLGAGSASGNVFSVFVKQGSGATAGNSFALRNDTTATNLTIVSLDYSTGVITGDVSRASVEAVSGGYRISIWSSTGISNGDKVRGYVGFIGSSETAGDYLYATGAQLETGTVASSYIPTVASAVARSADDIEIPLSRIPGFDPSSSYSLLCEFNAPETQGNFERVFSVNNGTQEDVVDVYLATGDRAVGFIKAGNVTQAAFSGAGSNNYTPNATSRIALRVAADDFAETVDGGPVMTDTSGSLPSGLTTIMLGDDTSAGRSLNGHIRRLIIVQSALSDAQLEAWSTSGGYAPVAAVLDLDFTTPSHEMPGYAFAETVLDDDFTGYADQTAFDAAYTTINFDGSNTVTLDAGNDLVTIVSDGTLAVGFEKTGILTSSETYIVEIDLTVTTGGVKVRSNGAYNDAATATGTYAFIIAGESSFSIVRNGGTTDVDINSITIKRVVP